MMGANKRCPCRETIPVMVYLAPDLSCTGEARWREFGIDKCIAPLVKALQEAGVNMRGSCCGHGKGPGEITLADHSILTIPNPVGDDKA